MEELECKNIGKGDCVKTPSMLAQVETKIRELLAESVRLVNISKDTEEVVRFGSVRPKPECTKEDCAPERAENRFKDVLDDIELINVKLSKVQDNLNAIKDLTEK